MSILSYDLNRGRKFNQHLNPNWDFFPKSWNSVNSNLSNMFKEIGEAVRSSDYACTTEGKLDIYEDTENYEVIVELPSVKKEDVKILATNDEQIEIKANKTPHVENAESAKKQVLIQERTFGKIERSIVFGKKINKNAIAAKWNNGELTITVPKAVSDEPKEVEIEIS